MQTTFAGALNRALREEMERDPTVLMIGLDIARLGGIFGVTKGLMDKFGRERVIDTPISETGFTGAAVGMAMEGLRPVVEIQFADFVTVTFDQITTVASKMFYLTEGKVSVPMVIRLPYGVNMAGGYMTAAGPHHSQSLEAWFCHCAGLKVVMPSSAADAYGLMKAAIRDNNPVVFCEQKGLYFVTEEIPDGEEVVPLGTAAVKREGKDVTLVATGATVGMSLKVADKLKAKGVSVEVIDPRTLIPLDTKTIFASVKKTGRVVITQEASQTMGFCSEVAAVIAEGAFASLKAPVKRVGALDMPIPAGDAAQGMLPTEERIENAIQAVLH